MHTFGETGAGVPAFLAKLWRLVDDRETDHLICWTKDGRSFIIQNQAQFARELLPLNYKHNNMASFIRQLNMYGFHKITSIDNGGLKFDRDEMEFSHPCFKRNCPYLLEHIKRKIANTKSLDDKASVKPEAVSKVLQDVKVMRGRQDSLDSRFSVMKQENESLWREIASLRQKHAKQQQIVNKLIQFLITIVQPSRNMTSVKRHMQLMINDTPENAKLRKTSESESSDGGPVIHELGEELLDEVADVDPDLIDPNSPYCKAASDLLDGECASPLNIERPLSSISAMSQNYDYSNQSADDVLNIAAAATPAASAGNINSTAANAAGAVFQSVNPDGSKIVYHVTEVPDTHPQETVPPAASPNYNEENVLTTPMVREEMARRTQLLKQKNKQRRKPLTTALSDHASTSSSNAATAAKVQRTNQTPQQPGNGAAAGQIQIKSEQEIDPMMFLNVFTGDSRGATPDPKFNSPNFSQDTRQSDANAVSDILGSIGASDPTAAASGAANAPPNDNASMLGSAPELYNSNEFIAEDMPDDIFENSALISGGNGNFSDNLKTSQQQQQQYGRTAASSGKFSSFIAGNSNNNSSAASTSAAANANVASTSAGAAVNRIQSTQAGGKNGNYMTVAKYKNAAPGNEDVMRDEVTGHLDNVQDELETLKDLLRSDGYSLDANTLLGHGTTTAQLNNNRFYIPQALDGDFFTKLFSDSDILGPYGLSSLPNDSSNDKKGSELMTYQPIYDLSDIIDMDEKTDLDGNPVNEITGPSGSRRNQPQSSALNTPYHE